MKIIQLYREGKEIIASDGILYVDGRLSIANTIHKVRERNTMLAKNFPHKVADSFTIYGDRIGSTQSRLFKV